MIKINKDHLRINPKPDRDIYNGLVMEVPKSETDTQKPIMTTNIIKGKAKYYYPKGITQKDITKAWLNE